MADRPGALPGVRSPATADEGFHGPDGFIRLPAIGDGPRASMGLCGTPPRQPRSCAAGPGPGRQRFSMFQNTISGDRSTPCTFARRANG